ncbi:MAG: ribosome silencing factor [Gammaproteobacteria bacterium]|nr:ribosome silencing factor [Gammaproteobacteria bacterium]
MEEKITKLVEALNDTKLTNLKVYDIKELSPFFDYFVVVTASNKRELRSAISKLDEKNIEYDHIEGESGESGWVLVDMNEIILNIMNDEMREAYGLDSRFIEQEVKL